MAAIGGAGASLSSFDVVPGAALSSLVIHVPHAGTAIPDWVRDHIVLDEAALANEIDLMTDARTDEIARLAASQCAIRPWLFVNQLSRLVIDPERFPDPAREPMASDDIGMGAVYLRTADGDVLRDDDDAHQRDLMEMYFHPYTEAFAELVTQRLDAIGRVTIIDLHSYPKVELPYERHHHAGAARPALCIGVDEFHTPKALVDAATHSFAGLGTVGVNAPFDGTYVPLKYLGVDTHVASVMIEIRRDTYVSSDSDLHQVAGMLTTMLSALT